MAEFAYSIQDWTAGVVQSVEGDKLPSSSLIEAKNTQFWHTGGGQTAIGTRSGLRRVCRFIDAGTGLHYDYVHMAPYAHAVSEGTAHSEYMVVVDKLGNIRFKDPGDTWDGESYAPNGASVAFSPVVSTIDSTVTNNRLFLLADTERRSLLGKTFVPFGMRAVTPSVTVDKTATVGSLPVDEYAVYVTRYEPRTGAESDPRFLGNFDIQDTTAPLVFTMTDEELEEGGLWEGTSIATNVYWRIYLQRLSTQSQPYLVQDVYDATSGLQITSTGNIQGQTSDQRVTLILTSEQIADLVVPMPLDGENTMLDSSAKYLAAYGRRLVAASLRKIFWSRLDAPDSFPPQNYEVLDTGQGDEITGIMAISDEVLIIWTKTATFGLVGNNPQTWTLKPLDLTVGCVGKLSAVQFDGKLAWWSPQDGPVVFDGRKVEKIGKEFLGEQALQEIVNFNTQSISAGWDPQSDVIVWAVPGAGDVKNTRMLPYNYRLGAWCASEWDPVSVPVMATGTDANGTQRLFVMDAGYTMMCFDRNVQTDGAGGGTLSGSFTAGASTISTITGTGFFYELVGAARDTLFDQRVTIVDADGQFVARRTISSNTATVLTLNREVVVTNGATYSYYISAPLMQCVTGWLDNAEPFSIKRHDRVYVDLKSSSLTVPVLMNFQTNNDSVNNVLELSVLVNQAVQATLDVTWDATVLLTRPFVKKRLGVWKNGHNCRLIVQQAQPVTVVLSKLLFTGRVLHDRYYL